MNEEKLTFDAPSWEYIEGLTVKLYKSIVLRDKYIPDLIAGISRGGIVPSRIISDLFLAQGRKVTLSIMQIGFYSGINKTEKAPIIYQDLPGHIYGRKLLLIDDVADTGVSLDFALKYLDMKKPAEIRVATLYYKPWSQLRPEYYVEKTSDWIIFPHERYEFMSEQYRNKKLPKEKMREYFIEEAGIPEASVKNFLDVVIKDEK